MVHGRKKVENYCYTGSVIHNRLLFVHRKELVCIGIESGCVRRNWMYYLWFS